MLTIVAAHIKMTIVYYSDKLTMLYEISRIRGLIIKDTDGGLL